MGIGKAVAAGMKLVGRAVGERFARPAVRQLSAFAERTAETAARVPGVTRVAKAAASAAKPVSTAAKALSNEVRRASQTRFAEGLAASVRRLKPQASVPGVSRCVRGYRGSRYGRLGGNG